MFKNENLLDEQIKLSNLYLFHHQIRFPGKYPKNNTPGKMRICLTNQIYLEKMLLEEKETRYRKLNASSMST